MGKWIISGFSPMILAFLIMLYHLWTSWFMQHDTEQQQQKILKQYYFLLQVIVVAYSLMIMGLIRHAMMPFECTTF